MKIAQVSPLIESVPPKLYGGTERIVSYLTEELVRQGHQVTLFASGDSITSAELVACVPAALRLNMRIKEALPYYVFMLEKIRQRANEFDILHFHIDNLHFPLLRCMDIPSITTMHGRMDAPELQPLYAEFEDIPLVSVSRHQQLPLPDAWWAGNIHHGLPLSHLAFTVNPQSDYLAFLGRMSLEKRPDRAIEIAKKAGMKLKIAAKVDTSDRRYFEEHIRPLLDHPLVEFIGEINDRQKAEFLGNARALLFPIDWPEPFGLVVIEAYACGTPVIAWPCGSIPEIIEEGRTGFIVKSIDEAVTAVRRAGMLDRATIRERFEQRFSVTSMVNQYLAIYRALLHSQPKRQLVPLTHAIRSTEAMQ